MDVSADHSYYRATSNGALNAPPLTGERRVDVCVIGAGFTGLGAALKAAEQGASVLVLEAQDVGFGASGRNGGQALVGYRTGAADMRDTFGHTKAKALFALALAARDRFWSRIRDLNIACDPLPGHVLAAARAKDMRWMQAEQRALADVFHYETQLLNADETAAGLGTRRYAGALLDAGGGHVHPLNLALGLARAAQKAGAEICERSPAVSIEPEEQGVVVRVASGALVRAGRVILATDCWIDRLAPALARYQMPVANYQIATAPLPADLAATILPTRWAVSDSRFVVNYFRRTGEDRIIFGGGERYSPRPPVDVPGFVRGHLLKVYPQLKDVPITHHWGGMVSITLTRYPHVGMLPGAGGARILFAHGYSGMGVIWGVRCGEILADKALAGHSAAFDSLAALPHHGFPGGGALRYPLHVAGMLWYALRDRL